MQDQAHVPQRDVRDTCGSILDGGLLDAERPPYD
jgi:hypothetical protein